MSPELDGASAAAGSQPQCAAVNEPERHEYTAALRVYSERLKFAQLEARLGKPSTGHDIGDPVSLQRPDGPKRRDAQWSLTSSIERGHPLDEHIDELVVFAEIHRDALDSLRADCSIDIFCGVFSGEDAQGGFALEPSLTRRLSDLQLTVEFDVY
jgi:hypothetical protein